MESNFLMLFAAISQKSFQTISSKASSVKLQQLKSDCSCNVLTSEFWKILNEMREGKCFRKLWEKGRPKFASHEKENRDVRCQHILMAAAETEASQPGLWHFKFSAKPPPSPLQILLSKMNFLLSKNMR